MWFLLQGVSYNNDNNVSAMVEFCWKLTLCGLVRRHVGSGSTLAQVMSCCLMALSHYLNQCWHLISEVLWDSPESNFTVSGEATILNNDFENYTSSVRENHWTHRTFPMARPKCLMRDFTNLNRILKAHRPNVVLPIDIENSYRLSNCLYR